MIHVRKNLFTEGMVRHWDRLPKGSGGVAISWRYLRKVWMFSGGLGNVRRRLDLILWVSSKLNDSVKIFQTEVSTH